MTTLEAIYLYVLLALLVSAIAAVPVYHGYQKRFNLKAEWFWPTVGLIVVWPGTLVFLVVVAVAYMLHALGEWLRKRDDAEDEQ